MMQPVVMLWIKILIVVMLLVEIAMDVMFLVDILMLVISGRDSLRECIKNEHMKHAL